MSCVPFFGGETQHEEGDAVPKRVERPVDVLGSATKGGHYACYFSSAKWFLAVYP